jgi:putative heme-binding domain-containing protein
MTNHPAEKTEHFDSAAFPATIQPMLSKCTLALALALALSAASTFGDDDPFAANIRTTGPLTPEQEVKAFHLPPGFEAQLVACEPDIGKPMNMAFDSKGRLWVTLSREYPFPVLPVEKPGRDRIVCIEDFDANGRAHKFTTFQTGLNIPIGLLPYKNGIIGFSIPKIHYFQDTDGDLHADKDEVLLTGFGYQKDTHGLTSNFRRGFDGWIYADHGFNNDSTITGKDGSSITVNSGNCYRFWPDGTHVEQHSFGQVNPFGLMFDPLGDLWSADCHSEPTYVLMHGAYYPSFGKPNDGLGFAPDVCTHQHGSTAICGMLFYDDDQWPQEYLGNTLIGNVMTCSINRDSYIQHGSYRVAKEEPDFLVSDDPWFRPVNIEFGPDGGMYMADFYNRIIGHYEVPLDHPGRDRERGRIWRVIYKPLYGKASRQDALVKDNPNRFDLSKASIDELLTELGSANIRRRMMATDELVDRIGKPAIKPVANLITSEKADAHQRAHGLWVLRRLGGLDDTMLTAAAHDSDRLVRVHAMRVLADLPQWNSTQTALAHEGLFNTDEFVQRNAADAVGRHPKTENVASLLKLRASEPDEDKALVYMTRMALRNQLMSDETFTTVAHNELSEQDQRFIADVAIGIKTKAAGSFLATYIDHADEPRAQMELYLKHIARYAPDEDMAKLAEVARKRFADDLDFQLALFKSVEEGVQQRGTTLPTSLHDWGTELAERLIVSIDPKKLDWRNSSIKGDDATNPWVFQERECADGKKARLISSLAPGGEALTGILRSRDFVIPQKLTIWVAGHDGSPEKPIAKKNFVRLREAGTDKVIKSARPPRNDVAQRVTWEIPNYAGKKGYIEVVDGNKGHSFAWLAIGRITPEVVSMPSVIPNQIDQRQRAAAELAAALKVSKLEQPIETLFLDDGANELSRSAAAKALMVFNANHAAELGRVLANAAEPQKLREECAKLLTESKLPEANTIIIAAFATAPQSLQIQLALALASKTEGAEALLNAVENGKASPRLLQDKNVKDRLTAAQPANLTARLANLTKGLPTADAERQKLIDERAAAFDRKSANMALGMGVFKKNCIACHQLDGVGATIGPQLDGIGNRGTDRVIEDILDPSRNVDPAFRVTMFMTKDGDVESGLFRREEGQMIVYADSTGKEHSVAKTDVTERRPSQLSLMPDNFGQAIAPEDFNNLLAYLLSKGGKMASKK